MAPQVAGRLVGGLFLEEGNLAQAFSYYKMLNELEPVRALHLEGSP